MSQYYTLPVQITSPIGNNAFSFSARQQAGSPCTLTIPELVFGWLEDVLPWIDIVFEEITSTWLIASCTWIQALVKTSLLNTKVPTYIMDNHNHALYFRYREHNTLAQKKSYTLLHIDQHADMETPHSNIDISQTHNLNYIAHYTNEVCHVGSFIQPAITTWLVQEVIQIRSVSKLLEYSPEILLPQDFILDIDIDFWVSHMPTTEEIATIHYLYKHASICTIALSPYFMALEDSLQVLHRIFAD